MGLRYLPTKAKGKPMYHKRDWMKREESQQLVGQFAISKFL
jgi:hypothetical protein